MTHGGHPFRAGAILFFVVLSIYGICPPFTSNDSYFVVPTALSILRHGSTVIDQYVEAAPAQARYAAECVPARGRAVLGATTCPDGHWYNFYPIGVPLLALPVVALVQLLMSTVAALMPGLAGVTSIPILKAFLAGDLAGGNSVVQLIAGSLFGALSAVLLFRIAARFLVERQAALLALLFAFGTSQFSVASRNLFQHGPSVLLLTTTLYLLIRAEDDPRLVRYAAVSLAAAFLVRPSNFVSAGLFAAYVAWRHPKQTWSFAGGALAIAVPFFLHNRWTHHTWLTTYYHYQSAGRNPFAYGFVMNLVSPSRGLLVFTPVVLFAVAGMILAWRRRWCWPLSPFLAAILFSHMLLIANYWPGHSYGPRYWSDMMPFWIFFLIPVLLAWQKLQGGTRHAVFAGFVLLAAWGVFTNTRGATSLPAQQWNMTPVNVDQAHDRVFDWSDPQFLRGLR